MFRPRKYVYLLLPFDSIDAAWKISKLVFCSHVFITVSKQLLNKLLSKKEIRQIGSELSSASRRSGMQLCNTYEPECCKLQVSRVAGFPCPLSQWNRGRKYGFWEFQRCLSFQHHPYLLHRGAINTQHITPFNFLFDCYFTRVFCLVFFGVFLFLPWLHRELCFLAELSKCPVKPLVTTFLLQEVPTEPNDKGRKRNIYSDVRNSQSGKKRSKRAGIRAHSAWSQAREGPPSPGLDRSTTGATLPHWEPGEPGCHEPRTSCVLSRKTRTRHRAVLTMLQDAFI